jgi:hypothetical protein
VLTSAAVPAPAPPPTLVPKPALDSAAAKWARAVAAAAALEAATGVGTADRAGVLHPEESGDDWATWQQYSAHTQTTQAINAHNFYKHYQRPFAWYVLDDMIYLHEGSRCGKRGDSSMGWLWVPRTTLLPTILHRNDGRGTIGPTTHTTTWRPKSQPAAGTRARGRRG